MVNSGGIFGMSCSSTDYLPCLSAAAYVATGGGGACADTAGNWANKKCPKKKRKGKCHKKKVKKNCKATCALCGAYGSPYGRA